MGAEQMYVSYYLIKNLFYQEMFYYIGAKYINPSMDEEPELELKSHLNITNGLEGDYNTPNAINTPKLKKERRTNNNIIDREKFATTILNKNKNKDKKDNCNC